MPDIIKTDQQNLITVTSTHYVKGRLFKVNEQYCYVSKETKLIGCGCGGAQKTQVTIYSVLIDGIIFDFDSRFVVEANGNEIPCEDQDFLKVRANIGDTQKVSDFNPFRQNNNPNEIANSANNIPM